MFRGFLMLAAVLSAVGLIWCGVIVFLMAQALLRPRRMSDPRALVKLRRLTPADLGMEFEELSFEVRDEPTGGRLKIAAWWLPHARASGRCAVLIHGYSDAKVGAIAWAPLLNSLGFHILAIDLRAHGQSEGKYCTAGFWERHDLNQVIDQIKSVRPEETRQMILFGISLGAAVAAAAAVEREDLAVVILESPYADYSHAITHQAERMGMPGPMFQRLALAAAQWIGKFNFSAVRPVEMIPRILCPVMVISSGDDPFVPPEDLAALQGAVESRESLGRTGVYWGVGPVHHVLGISHDPQEYGRRINEFLSQAIEASPAKSSP